MSEPDIRDDVNNAQVEALLPIEGQLVGWSLGIGMALLIGFIIVNHYFPVTL